MKTRIFCLVMLALLLAFMFTSCVTASKGPDQFDLELTKAMLEMLTAPSPANAVLEQGGAL